MNPDRAQAEAFISALTGSSESEVTWQLLSDNKAGPHFAQTYHLPLALIWRELTFRNGTGVGIFIMVNRGDGSGRHAANVVGLRALFIDDDKGVVDPTRPCVAGAPPNIVVRSKRGCHLYWLLQPGQPIESFSFGQQTLALHFGTDTAVKDLPRVLRVPGFFHCKDPNKPSMVQLVSTSLARRYTIDELVRVYPAPPGAATTKAPSTRRAAGPKASKHQQGAHPSPAEALGTLEEFARLGVFKWAEQNPTEVSREAWRGIGTNIAAIVLDVPEAERAGEALFQRMSANDPTRYSQADTSRTFQDALKSARDYGPMRYDTLMDAGVPQSACVGAAIGPAPIVVARKLFRERGRTK